MWSHWKTVVNTRNTTLLMELPTRAFGDRRVHFYRWIGTFHSVVNDIQNLRFYRSVGVRDRIRSEIEIEVSMGCTRIWFVLALHTLAVAQILTSNNSTQHENLSASDWNSEELRVSKIDPGTVKFGETRSHNQDIQVGENVFPTRFVDEISSWKYVEEDEGGNGKKMQTSDAGLWESVDSKAAMLEPFRVEGPLELLIVAADHLRLVLPDGTMIGGFKQIILADHAIVTIEGARQVSLARPVDFPLMLNTSVPVSGPGSRLWSLAESLRYATQVEGQPLLALCIVSPTLMVAASSGDQDTAESKLEARFFAPGALELSLHRLENFAPVPSGRLGDQQMWPLISLNSSDLKVLFMEQLLVIFLGNRAFREGSFKILRASAMASAFVEIQLELEKKLSNDSFNSELWPPWRTKPAVQRLHFEVLARLEGNRLKPLVIRRLKPFIKVETYLWRDLMSNVSFTSFPSRLVPAGPLTLDVQ